MFCVRKHIYRIIEFIYVTLPIVFILVFEIKIKTIVF